MRFSFASCLFGLGVIALPIEPTAVSAWEQSKANPNVSQQITTVTGELDVLEKAANSWNGGWYDSWNLMKEATALGRSLGEVVKNVENSEGLSEEDSASVLKALSGLAPEMTKVTDILHERKEYVTRSELPSYLRTCIEDMIEDMRKHANNFFEMIGKKVVDGDKGEVQKLQEKVDAEFVTAQAELSSSP